MKVQFHITDKYGVHEKFRDFVDLDVIPRVGENVSFPDDSTYPVVSVIHVPFGNTIDQIDVPYVYIRLVSN